MWAEITLPFAWANPLHIYMRVTADAEQFEVRVIDASKGEPFHNGIFKSEMSFGSRYFNIPLEPDLHLKTARSLQGQGLTKRVRERLETPSESQLMYHERLLRLPLRFDASLSEGGPYPGPYEGSGKTTAPVLCTHAGPVHTETYSFVWTP